MPFDRIPAWREIRKLSLSEQEAALRNPENAAQAGRGGSSAA